MVKCCKPHEKGPVNRMLIYIYSYKPLPALASAGLDIRNKLNPNEKISEYFISNTECSSSVLLTDSL